MIIIGNPNKNKQKLKDLIFNIKIDQKYLTTSDLFRTEILQNIRTDMTVLDVGKSMRQDFLKLECKEKKTLDINTFNDYPDIQLDLSEEIEIEKTE